MRIDLLLEALLVALSVIVLVPALFLLFECLAARPGVYGANQRGDTDITPPRLAMLIPAHNEARHIGATIVALASELGPRDRLIVIADNCQDETARVVRETAATRGLRGVTTVERQDPSKVGKGFAISFGVEHLAADPPDVVVLVDADCRVSPGSVAALARAATHGQAPVQGEYLLTTAASPSPLGRVSELAFLVRNRVRPRGLARLGLPCLLTGSGMAFPWPILRGAPETHGNLVEDMVLGLELALQGHPPRLCPEAQISSELPDGSRAALRQRKRWEHGHLHTLVAFVPRLLKAAFVRRDPGLLALAAELCVPPLALLVVMQTVLLSGALAAGFLGAPWARGPIEMGALGLAATGLAATVAWWRFARAVVPAWAMLVVPLYLAWKLPLYVVLLVKGKQRTWERTARPGEDSEPLRPPASPLP